jgi:hypothetical protein
MAPLYAQRSAPGPGGSGTRTTSTRRSPRTTRPCSASSGSRRERWSRPSPATDFPRGGAPAAASRGRISGSPRDPQIGDLRHRTVEEQVRRLRIEVDQAELRVGVLLRRAGDRAGWAGLGTTRPPRSGSRLRSGRRTGWRAAGAVARSGRASCCIHPGFAGQSPCRRNRREAKPARVQPSGRSRVPGARAAAQNGASTVARRRARCIGAGFAAEVLHSRRLCRAQRPPVQPPRVSTARPGTRPPSSQADAS